MDSLSDVINVIRAIIRLTQQSEVDESQFPIFRDILDSYASKVEQKSEKISSDAAWKNWKRSLEAFSAKLVLSSGQSMDLIWAQMRSAVPNSQKAWNIYIQLMDTGRTLADCTTNLDMGKS